MLKPMGQVPPAPLLTHSAQENIKEYIIANRLRAGDALPSETELVGLLGISRNSVREAVQALAALGIIEIRRGSGLIVGRFSLEPLLDNLPFGLLFGLHELTDLLEVRRVIEVGMIELAMQHISDEQRAALQQGVVGMQKKAARGENFIEEDREFHRALFSGLKNEILLRLLDTFWLTYTKAAEHSDIQPTYPMRVALDHVAVLDAVLSGDVVEAKTTLERHYVGIVEQLNRGRRGQAK